MPERENMNSHRKIEYKVNTIADLGAYIRKIRQSLKLTQVEVAGLCGVGTRFLSDLENGKETIEAGKVLVVLKALGVKLTLQ
jgi:HTH-type transcriptional regulator / antitoxin HipB